MLSYRRSKDHHSMRTVFVSYRRGDSEGQARALKNDLVELIGKSTQSGAGRFGVGSAGKPPQERGVVVIAQSVFFWLLRHRSVPSYCH